MERLEITVSELEDFVNTRVWRILVQAMIDATHNKYADLATLDPVQQPVEMARAQGYMQGLGWIMDYPALLKEQIEYEQNEEEIKNERSGERT